MRPVPVPVPVPVLVLIAALASVGCDELFGLDTIARLDAPAPTCRDPA